MYTELNTVHFVQNLQQWFLLQLFLAPAQTNVDVTV